MKGITLKREDVPNCKCGEVSKNINFYGYHSEGRCSHFYSNKDDHCGEGWWMRIDHREGYDDKSEWVRKEDVVGQIQCPECHKKGNALNDELMKDFF